MRQRLSLSDKTKQEMRAGAASLFRNNREALWDARKGPEWTKWRERELYVQRQIQNGNLRLIPQLRDDGSGFPATNPTHVVVQVGLCTFIDTVKSFPSTKLVAEIALAIQAGQHEVLAPSIPEIEEEVREIIAGAQRGVK